MSTRNSRRFNLSCANDTSVLCARNILRFSSFLVGTIVLGGLLTGCSSDPLAEQYKDGSEKGYVAGDGSITQLTPAKREDPVTFEGVTEDGEKVSSATYLNTTLVLNFWYAACAPCRAEAPTLEALSEEFANQNVKFLGVNVRDQAAAARSFNTTYGVTYPSIMDGETGTVKLTLSSTVPPNAVPTTLVLDAHGRVAARILGAADPSILRTLIQDTLAEDTNA